MAKEIRKLTLASIHSKPHATCDIYGRGHPTHECQASIEEVNAVGNYNFNAMGQKHPGFSWSSPGVTVNTWQQNNPRFQGQGASGFVNQPRPQFQPQQPIQYGLEDTMKSIIVKKDERLDAHDAIKELGTGLRNLEKQVGQIIIVLSEKIPGTLPADTERNPKETVNVVTLRSGQVLKHPTPVQNERVPKKEIGEQLKNEVDKKKKGKKGAETKKEELSRMEEYNESEHMLALPLLQKLSALTNASVCQILKGDRDKEEKDRRYIGGQAHIALECNLAKQTPTKLKLDNELGEIRPAPISLQLADQTTIIPKGIVEDILVRVDKFVLIVDFIVVKMEENKVVPLILGRPFLVTGRAILDIHDRKLMLRVGDEMVTFEMNVETGVKMRSQLQVLNGR
ncbi:uncharacterized protein [Nicotiana tomentosiformis]|uniref:uncharacterized protein n=1 Tax=Nicotiana tomentosiformis TaxID=4098 RepID=UPI00388C41FE